MIIAKFWYQKCSWIIIRTINPMEIWMRSFLINKNLSLYYLLRKKIGKKQGLVVASIIEKALLIFGREKMPV